MTSTEIATTAQPSSMVGPAEWQMISEQAAALSKSRIVPEAYQNKPDDIIAAALMGREVGWSPVLALKYINVIKGKASVGAEGMIALVRTNGHSVTIVESTITSATVKGRRADTGDEMTVTFTWEDAQRAGLAGGNQYRNHPAQMLVWRAVSRLCRFLFPDAIAGMSYTADEAEEIARNSGGTVVTDAVVEAEELPTLSPEQVDVLVLLSKVRRPQADTDKLRAHCVDLLAEDYTAAARKAIQSMCEESIMDPALAEDVYAAIEQGADAATIHGMLPVAEETTAA